MKTAVVIAAGGTGQRTGLGYPKQLYELCGMTVLERSVRAFSVCELIDIIIIVCHNDIIDKTRELADKYPKIACVATGGATRQKSVCEGLKALPGDTGLVLIHDAARPFVSRALISRVIEGAKEYGACVPVLRPVDTVKLLEGGFIGEELDRNRTALIQTPQGFLTEGLLELYERSEADFGDDSGLLRSAGRAVAAVRGDSDNIKITTERDLITARDIIRKRGM